MGPPPTSVGSVRVASTEWTLLDATEGLDVVRLLGEVLCAAAGTPVDPERINRPRFRAS